MLLLNASNSEWQPCAIGFCQTDALANSHEIGLKMEHRFIPVSPRFIYECPAIWHLYDISSQIGLTWPEAPNRGAHRSSSDLVFVNHAAGFEREVKEIAAVGGALRILRTAREFQTNVAPIHAAILLAL